MCQLKYRMKKLLCQPIFVSVVILFANLLLATPRFQTDDDWGIGNYFSGVKGPSNSYCPFVHIFLAKFLCFLYRLFPQTEWNFFGLYEYLLIFISFCVLIWFVIQNCTKHFLKIISLLLLLCISPQFYIFVQFTKTAALACFAGVLGLLSTAFQVQKKMESSAKQVWKIILFSFLVFAGYILRQSCFFLCLPMFSITVLKNLFEEKAFTAFWKRLKVYIKVFGAIFICVFCSIWIHDTIYARWNTGYLEFNAARANFIDYKKPAYEDVKKELRQLGVSANDYALINGWTFEDTEFITTDLLNELGELQEGENYAENAKSFFSAYSEKVVVPYIIAIVFIIIVAWICEKIQMGIECLGLLFLTNAISFYFVVSGRYPSYVKFPVFFFLLYWIWVEYFLPIVSEEKMKENPKNLILSIISIFLIILVGTENKEFFEVVGREYLNENGKLFFQTLNQREDKIYITASSTGAPSLRSSYGVFRRATPGIYNNIVSVGGWSARHPLTLAQYSRLGIENPMQEFDKKNIYVIETPDLAQTFQIYMWEHTGKWTSYSVVEELMNAKIFAYRTNFENVKADESWKIKKVVSEMDEDDERFQRLMVTTNYTINKGDILYLEVINSSTEQKRTYECMHMEGDSVVVKIPVADWQGIEVYQIKLLRENAPEGVCYSTHPFFVAH